MKINKNYLKQVIQEEISYLLERICPYCKSEVKDTRFCTQCGEKNPDYVPPPEKKVEEPQLKADERVCPECKKVVSNNKNFCTWCGAPNPNRQKASISQSDQPAKTPNQSAAPASASTAANQQSPVKSAVQAAKSGKNVDKSNLEMQQAMALFKRWDSSGTIVDMQGNPARGKLFTDIRKTLRDDSAPRVLGSKGVIYKEINGKWVPSYKIVNK